MCVHVCCVYICVRCARAQLVCLCTFICILVLAYIYIYVSVCCHCMFQRLCAGIILDQSAVDVRNTVLKMVEYNNRNRTDTADNRIVIEEDITTVDMDDSFRLSSTSQ